MVSGLLSAFNQADFSFSAEPTLPSHSPAVASNYKRAYLDQKPEYFKHVVGESGIDPHSIPQKITTIDQLKKFEKTLYDVASPLRSLSGIVGNTVAHTAYNTVSALWFPATLGAAGYAIDGEIGMTSGFAVGVGTRSLRSLIEFLDVVIPSDYDKENYHEIGLFGLWGTPRYTEDQFGINLFIGGMSMVVSVESFAVLFSEMDPSWYLPLVQQGIAVASVACFALPVLSPVYRALQKVNDLLAVPSWRYAVSELLAKAHNPFVENSYWNHNLKDQFDLVNLYVREVLQKDIAEAKAAIGDKAEKIARHRENLKKVTASGKLSPEAMESFSRELNLIIDDLKSQKSTWEKDILPKYQEAEAFAEKVLNKIRVELGMPVKEDLLDAEDYEALTFRELEIEKQGTQKSGIETKKFQERAEKIVNGLNLFFKNIEDAAAARRELLPYEVTGTRVILTSGNTHVR